MTTITAFLFVLVTASGCALAVGPVATDLQGVGSGQVTPDQVGRAEDWGRLSIAEIASESAKLLVAEAGLSVGQSQCKIDTFRFRLTDDKVAITSPPAGFFTTFPPSIPTFNDPKLKDSYLFVVTVRDVDNNIVGFASEQEIVDLVKNESKTSYTLTLPGRGTLMLTERESFQSLMDAVKGMVADQEPVRTFNPPLIHILTIPGTGKVTGGSGEFEGATGVMREIGIIYKIDLLHNEFDVGVIVQALHC